LPLGLAVLAIAGQPGEIADDGVATPGQTVEERGLAHVGTAHKGDYGNHEAHTCYLKKTQRPLPWGSGRSSDAPGHRAGPSGPDSCYLMVSATSLPPLP